VLADREAIEPRHAAVAQRGKPACLPAPDSIPCGARDISPLQDTTMTTSSTRGKFLALAALAATAIWAAAAVASGPVTPAVPGTVAPPAWSGLSAAEREAVLAYAEEYKDFLSRARTELSFVAEAVKLAQDAGFRPLNADSPLTPGARYYDVNRDRAMALIVVGNEPFRDGFRLIGAHIDSPRIELKGRPLYEREGFALFQTYTHGGIKNYQWVSLPLALMGHVDMKDGTRVPVSVGLKPEDPVLIIPDLSPHVDQDYRERMNRDVIGNEELDPIVASLPDADNSISGAVLAYLESEYGIEENDLVSAELALVPAMMPRDVGLDRSLMAIYGQDDRLSGYAALRAIGEQDRLKRTAIAYLVDNEEVGNVNNTGASSTYIVDLMSKLVHRQRGDRYNDYDLRHALRQTRVVSSDVNPGIHPTWPDAWEVGNAPRLGHGVNFKLYGGGFNANSEYIAWTRAYFDAAGIAWQTATYKDQSSGGTIGNSLSKDNMEVIDFGVPVLSIHSTYAVSSKVDVHMLYRAMAAFYRYRN